MNPSLKERLLSPRAVPSILLFAFLLRLAWAFAFAPVPVSDFAQYHSLAVTLAHGHGYMKNGHPTAFLPPGYPAFLGFVLWISHDSLLAARIANAILGVGVAYFSYRIAQRALRSELAARLVLVILVVYPNHLAYVSLLSTELLFLALLTGGIWLLMNDRWWGAIGGGLALGWGALVKPLGLFLFAAYCVIRVATVASQRRPQGLVRLLLAGLGLAAVLVPWAIRNYAVFNRYVSISDHGGQTLLIGHNPLANGTYSKEVFDTRIATLRAGRTEVEADRYASHLAITYARTHVGRETTLLPRKLFYLYATDGEGFYFNQRGLPVLDSGARRLALKALKVVNYAFYWALLLAGLAALSTIVLRDRLRVGREFMLPLGLIASITIYYLAFFGISRFHFPIVPWLAMLAVYPIARRSVDGSSERSAAELGVSRQPG